jgi:quercetin dioxygenase-like cupin family protein
MESIMRKFFKSSWMETSKEQLNPKLSQRVFTTNNVMVVHYTYEPGLEFEQHSHPQEQVTIVQTGRLLMRIEGEIVELKKGDVCFVAPTILHSTSVLGDERVESISIFSPVAERVVTER